MVLAVGLASILACGGDATSPGVPGDLVQQHARWVALGIRDYDFRVTYANEWFPSREALVQVRSGSVVQVTDVESGDLIPNPGSVWPTVDSLFVYARRAVDDPEQEVDLLFHPTKFYPTRVHIDAPQWADDSQTWTTRNIVHR